LKPHIYELRLVEESASACPGLVHHLATIYRGSSPYIHPCLHTDNRAGKTARHSPAATLSPASSSPRLPEEKKKRKENPTSFPTQTQRNNITSHHQDRKPTKSTKYIPPFPLPRPALHFQQPHHADPTHRTAREKPHTQPLHMISLIPKSLFSPRHVHALGVR
jgi:hypothetical protein